MLLSNCEKEWPCRLAWDTGILFLFQGNVLNILYRSVIRQQSLELFFYAQRSLCTERSHHLLEYVGRLQVFCRSWAYPTRPGWLVSTDHGWCKISAWAFLALPPPGQQSEQSRRNWTAYAFLASQTLLCLWRRFGIRPEQIQPKLDKLYTIEQLDPLWSCLWSPNAYRAAVWYMQSLWTTKNLLKDCGFWSKSQVSTKFAWQLSKVFRTGAQISINPCQLLFQTWYGVVILFSGWTLTNNEGSSTTNAEQIWVLISGRHSGVLVNHQLSEAHNTNANEQSAHTYHKLPSLNHPENYVVLLLVWSSDCHGWALWALHAWAILDDSK